MYPFLNSFQFRYQFPCRADNAAYSHDGRADKRGYRHDRRVDSQCPTVLIPTQPRVKLAVSA